MFLVNSMVVLSLQQMLQRPKTVAMPAVAMYEILGAGYRCCQA